MYRKIILSALATVALVQSSVFAATSPETYDPTLQAAASCADVEATMKDYLKGYTSPVYPMAMEKMSV
jgi:hypothetical protein